jgi:NitT/TauT family transport system permease protein
MTAAASAQRGKRVALAILLPAVFLLGWELLGRNDLLVEGLIPTPTRVLQAWWVWIFGAGGLSLNPYSGTWAANLWFSLERVGEGYLLAIVLGVPVGVLIGWSRLAAQMVDPSIQWLRPIPITAWLPFSIALFGIKDFGAIFLITLGAFYPIVVNTTQGARDVDKNLVRAARMMGAGNGALLRRVILPAALPAVFSGLRVGLGIAWTAVIVAEMVAVKSGLGYVLWDAYYVGRMDVVIADMLSIGLMGYVSDRLVVLVEGRLLTWRRLQSH